MKIFRIYILVLLASLATVSCTEKESGVPAGTEGQAAVSGKIIHRAEDAVGGSLLVYLSEDAAAAVTQAGPLTRSGSGDGVLTRSGVAALDMALTETGAVSVSPLFVYPERNAREAHAAGLHRWYLVTFDRDMDLDGAARGLAAVPEVTYVEFNRRLAMSDSFSPVAFTAADAVVPQAGTGAGATFNDPYLGNQWHYINTGNTDIFSGIREGADINVRDAWRLCTGDPRVVVAIVDQCVDWTHEDLAANMWVNEAEKNGTPGVDDDGNGYTDDIYGYNGATNGQLELTPGDDGWHGTHVAGTVAAVNNNGTGVCGVAGGDGTPGSGVRLMSCQVFDPKSDESGSVTASARAITYAANNGACIIQCSFGYQPEANITSDDRYTQVYGAEKSAIDYFSSVSNCPEVLDGGLVIFAAGNDMISTSGYPGGYRDYISVTAMSCDYTPAYYTNYGPGCNVAAPGGDVYQSYLTDGDQQGRSQILSTVPGGYAYLQGTSMACPHVSGVAALGLSYALELGKKFTREEFNSILLTSVNGIDRYCTGTKYYLTQYGGRQTVDLSAHKGKMGTGYIDAYQVLMNVRGTTCIPVPAGEQTQIDISEYLGDGDATFSVLTAEVSADDKAALGMTSDPRTFGKTILLTCGRTGTGILKVSLRAGTNSGSGMSGKTVEREFALVARQGHTQNGGWL